MQLLAKESNLPSTGDPWLDLLGGVVRIAVRDAARGNAKAQEWLAEFWPEFESERQKCQRDKSRIESTYQLI